MYQRLLKEKKSVVMKSVPFVAYSVKKYSVSFLVIITIFFYLIDKKKSEYKARGKNSIGANKLSFL